MQDLKTAFILQALAEYNQRSTDQMRIAMRRLGVGVTDEGYNSIAYKVFQSGAGAYSNLSFMEYLRFVDMGAGRSHPLGGIASVTVRLQASKQLALKQIKDKVRKPKKIYSKIVYGEIGFLHNTLRYGYTEQTIALLKQQLEGQ
ncbi:MAG TPA: hypothetical protein VG847_06130, partial [Chitinophagaceae bacterium]|nr:hypothetical protein [Chitinophagaceae bacterium]